MPLKIRDRGVAKHKADNQGESPTASNKQLSDECSTVRNRHDTSPWLKVIIASFLVCAAFFCWKWTRSPVITLVPATTRTDQFVYTVPCSRDYDEDSFHECKPKRCARVVMDNLVKEDEAAQLLRVAKKGLVIGGSSGGASILDLHSGALSYGDKFINIYSVLSGDELFTPGDVKLYSNVKERIRTAISDYFNVPLSSLFLTKPTFFSRMNTAEAKTIHDEYWHPHIDRETYGSFHYTSLLYLTTYNHDFTGGRFVFMDQDTNRTVEPRLGRVSFFTSGSENEHFVEKLVDGVRFAITISFTCNKQMAIADPVVRAATDRVFRWIFKQDSMWKEFVCLFKGVQRPTTYIVI